MILISACLLGVNCKYNGKSNEKKEIIEFVKTCKALLVCPEQLGGLSTPRNASEIIGGSGEDVLDGKARVITKEGEDVTHEFVKGAKEVLKMAKICGVKKAILKARSPSCGTNIIYDGTFTSHKREGNGVTAALLKRNDIIVIDEESIISL